MPQLMRHHRRFESPRNRMRNGRRNWIANDSGTDTTESLNVRNPSRVDRITNQAKARTKYISGPSICSLEHSVREERAH